MKPHQKTQNSINYIVGGILAFIFLAALATSCTKQRPDDFRPVIIQQGGELILLQGFLPAAQDQPWKYVVEIDLCGVKEYVGIEFPKGQVYTEVRIQSNCKYGSWKIVYNDIKRD